MMNLNNFIFSEKRSDRIKRHLIFWMVWVLYYGILHAASPFLKPEDAYFQRTRFALTEAVLHVIPQMVMAYMVFYFVLPLYTRKRKILEPIVLAFAFWFVCGYLNLFMFQKVNPVVLDWLLPDHLLINTQRPPEVSTFMALMATWKGAMTGTAFLVGIHYIKQWFLKEQRNLQLTKENTEAQLQLLMAQVHPHFLFNTLNNIFSQVQYESPKGSQMIMGLSDLLRYILYEGKKSLVPLKHELTMVQEYIDLERIRYGNKLEVHVQVPDKTDEMYIAPLLLLPFVENCFKHGTSHVLHKPWINLTVEIKESTLVMKLMNGKAPENGALSKKPGIGIQNVRKRLELLYSDKYELQIREEEEVFVVDLIVELIRMQNPEPETSITASKPRIEYA